MSAKALALALLIIAIAPTTIADTIPPAYRQVALSHHVPADIFYAIALAESGRTYGSNKAVRPWPWTLNIHGRGVYYPDRLTAWHAIVASLSADRLLVDIGLMQVNWRYHHDRLVDPWHALDPYRNLQIAAGILKRCHERLSDWWQAVGCYHAPSNPKRALQYSERVRAHWRSVTL